MPSSTSIRMPDAARSNLSGGTEGESSLQVKSWRGHYKQVRCHNSRSHYSRKVRQVDGQSCIISTPPLLATDPTMRKPRHVRIFLPTHFHIWLKKYFSGPPP